MAWACGLGKLGGVGQGFLPPDQRGEGWEERVKTEERVRLYRYKGSIVEPPKNGAEYGQRVRLL